MSDDERVVTIPITMRRGARGAVASPHHLASQAGAAILHAGGSAVDAAIATNAALSVVAGYMCGLGGDAFWIIWDQQADRAVALNGSGRSAARATIEAARAAGLEEIPVRGPWTITVPGAIRSWGDAHERFGRLPWADLFGPAIDLADGFPASETWIASVERSASVYGTDGDWARTYRTDARPGRPGDMVRLPALAATLRTLAADGPDVSYSGRLAERAAAYLESSGSPLRIGDFRPHRSDWLEPIATTYRGVTSLSHPANSCGPIALELLNTLACFAPPPAESFTAQGPTDARWVHVGLEAARRTLADRDRWLTDPDHMEPGAAERLIDPERAAELARMIDPDKVGTPAATTLPTGGGTIYLTTADRWGGLVSLIESNYTGFGSGLVDPETGIAYQNRGAFFRLDPSHANALAPGKRTVHTLTPGMLLRDGRPWIAHGSMGGEIQPQLFAQFVSAIVDGGIDIGTAIAAPRWVADVGHHLGPPSLTVLEPRFRPDVPDGLRRRGHTVTFVDPFDSGMGHQQAIEVVREGAHPDAAITFAAAADPRSEGSAVAL